MDNPISKTISTQPPNLGKALAILECQKSVPAHGWANGCPRSIGYQLCLQRGPKNLASAGTVVHAVHRLQGLLQNTWTSLDGQIIITVPTSIINKGIATSKASLLVTRASMPLLWTPNRHPAPTLGSIATDRFRSCVPGHSVAAPPEQRGGSRPWRPTHPFNTSKHWCFGGIVSPVTRSYGRSANSYKRSDGLQPNSDGLPLVASLL